MKKLVMIVSALVMAATFAFEATAQDKAVLKAIKARQGQMQLYAFNIGILGAMAKGKMAYDAKKAQAAADNLVSLSNLMNVGLWPKGSDMNSPGLSDKTAAKPEIWTTYPKVVDASKNMKAGAKAMAESEAQSAPLASAAPAAG